MTLLDKKKLGKFISNYEVTVPFNNLIIDFIDDIAQSINRDKKISTMTDIKSFGFWARRKNLVSMKENFLNGGFRSAIGLIFHVPPTNTPINLVYSLFFGLITGNANIVKVPSKFYFQSNYLIKLIEKTLKKKKIFEIKKYDLFCKIQFIEQ